MSRPSALTARASTRPEYLPCRMACSVTGRPRTSVATKRLARCASRRSKLHDRLRSGASIPSSRTRTVSVWPSQTLTRTSSVSPSTIRTTSAMRGPSMRSCATDVCDNKRVRSMNRQVKVAFSNNDGTKRIADKQHPYWYTMRHVMQLQVAITRQPNARSPKRCRSFPSRQIVPGPTRRGPRTQAAGCRHVVPPTPRTVGVHPPRPAPVGLQARAVSLEVGAVAPVDRICHESWVDFRRFRHPWRGRKTG